MFFVASSINNASRKSLVFMKNLPSTMWCAEMERFNDNLRYETIALSGMKFFDFTRNMVLGMAATIVTYELVLLQFDDKSVKPQRNFCN
jgi:gustatory receptor